MMSSLVSPWPVLSAFVSEPTYDVGAPYTSKETTSCCCEFSVAGRAPNVIRTHGGCARYCVNDTENICHKVRQQFPNDQ